MLAGAGRVGTPEETEDCQDDKQVLSDTGTEIGLLRLILNVMFTCLSLSVLV